MDEKMTGILKQWAETLAKKLNNYYTRDEKIAFLDGVEFAMVEKMK